MRSEGSRGVADSAKCCDERLMAATCRPVARLACELLIGERSPCRKANRIPRPRRGTPQYVPFNCHSIFNCVAGSVWACVS